MKVLNLRCESGHGFEGWFASEDEFLTQNGGGLIECPMCGDKVISRMPSAPRLNLAGARSEAPAQPPQPADPQAAWQRVVRELMARTENVGNRFAEEARRIHYGEKPERGIRGTASSEERAQLRDEGIETLTLPMPRAFEGPLQ